MFPALPDHSEGSFLTVWFIYPEYDPGTNDTLWGVQEHSDYGGLTFLYQDQAGGLEARNPVDGKWIEIPPVKDTFVVNIERY